MYICMQKMHMCIRAEQDIWKHTYMHHLHITFVYMYGKKKHLHIYMHAKLYLHTSHLYILTYIMDHHNVYKLTKTCMLPLCTKNVEVMFIESLPSLWISQCCLILKWVDNEYAIALFKLVKLVSMWTKIYLKLRYDLLHSQQILLASSQDYFANIHEAPSNVFKSLKAMYSKSGKFLLLFLFQE
jgi:hypothetical protein